MNDHPYTLDRWATPDDPEISSIRFADLRSIERASQGIWAIARIVGNGVNESDAYEIRPLDPWVTSNLLGGVEALCDHIANILEESLDGPPLNFGSGNGEKPVH